ncbi:hypothetical protein RCC89_18435 [Cytophagaceae bacterium ABcell3]|nr:hypothetical protein RCC89_18435 [Cytophagaceae bacterium ABcell3]
MRRKLLQHITIFLLLVASTARAQENNFLERLIPRDFTVQYAGGIGMFSAGINYPMANNKLDLSFLYGHVPPKFGGKLNKITTKFQYNPFDIRITENISLRPVNPVFFLSFTLNRNHHLIWPRDQYGAGYYWWNSAMRWHLGLSSEVRFHSFEKTIFSYVAAYIEANVQDMYLYARLDNPDYFTFYDVMYIGTGIRFGIKNPSRRHQEE